jgi:hypothetical protein
MAINLRCTNPKKQGDIGLGCAIGWFTTKGYTVCIPLTDSQDYDLVVDSDGQLLRVQVRTTTYKSVEGVFRVELRTKGGNKSGNGKVKYFTDGPADLLFVLTDAGEKYLIPKAAIRSRCFLNLGNEFAPYRCGD